MQTKAPTKRLRFKSRLFWSVFSRALSSLLIVNFSGIPTALAAAATAPNAANAANAPLLKEGNDLAKEISTLLFLARNPNTLTAGPADPAGLKKLAFAAEDKLFKWKGKLETFLASGKPEADGAL